MVQRFLLCILLCLVCSAREATVHILQTSDLHANLTGNEDAPGGILKLSTLLKATRAQLGSKNCVYIDTGDTMQGSMLGTLTRGAAPLEMLRLLNCDVWIPGNHDFDFGPAAFLAAADSMRTWLICGNLRGRGDHGVVFPAWETIDCNGVKIAVIGATASYLPHWFLADFDQAFAVESAAAMLRRVLPGVLASHPDAIVLGIHQGWMGSNQDDRGVNEVAAIAREFPEIDLILGGHTHRPFAGQPVGAHSWYVQPAAHGAFFAQVDLTCDLDKHCVTKIESRLVQPAPDTPDDAQLQAALAPQLKAVREAAESVIHAPLKAAVASGGRPGISCPMSELLCRVIAEASGAQIALHSTLSKAEFTAGRPITGADLYAVVPYENTIVTAEVTPAELQEIVAEQWTLRNVYTFCGLWGAVAHISETGAVQLPGLDPAQRCRIAINSFTAAGGGRTPVLSRILAQPEARMANTGIPTREALRQWLTRHPEDFTITPRVWLQAP